MLEKVKDTGNENIETVQLCSFSSGLAVKLPAETGNQWLRPDRGDDKERLCSRFGFKVLLAGHQEVPFHVVLWVQSVELVGRLDYFRGHQAWLTRTETIHGIGKAAVCVMGAGVVILVAAVGGGTAGAVPRD